MGRLSRKSARKDSLLQLQKQIHEALLRESRTLLGKPTGVLKRYEQSYHRSLKSRLGLAKPASKEELLSKISRTSIVLMGDFHPYPQSQRAAHRLLREMHRQFPQRQLVLGLEMFTSDLQRDLDRYLEGKLSEQKLIERSHCYETWGFSWQHFEPLLRFARSKGIRLLALNRPGEHLPPTSILEQARDQGDLGARDEWAAALMLDQIQEEPRSLILALYGEYHLAPSHLPARVKDLAKYCGEMPPDLLTIYQNIDELFWRVREKLGHSRSNLFRLSETEYCHFSGTPWTKLQALVNWIHGDPALFSDEELDMRSEFLGWMQNYGELVARFFGLKSPGFSEVDVYGLHGNLGLPILPRSQQKTLLDLLENQERIYERHDGQTWVYTPSVSENSAAELGSVHLRHGRRRTVLPLELENPEDLAERTLDHLAGFMGSLLINPRRKCDQLADQQTQLRKRGAESFAGEKNTRREVIRYMKLCLGSQRITAERLRPVLAQTLSALPTSRLRFAFARFLGHWLGHAIHDEMVIGEISLEEARSFFSVEDSMAQLSHALELTRNLSPGIERRTRHETL